MTDADHPRISGQMAMRLWSEYGPEWLFRTDQPISKIPSIQGFLGIQNLDRVKPCQGYLAPPDQGHRTIHHT